MSYITSYCPSCGHRIDVMRPSKDKAYGCPFRKCPTCNITYYDSHVIEMALQDWERVDKRKHSPRNNVLIGFGIASLLIYWIDAVYRPELNLAGITVPEQPMVIFLVGGLLLLALGLFIYIDEHRNYSKRQVELRREYDASLARLSDPAYATLLKSRGCSVPKKFLINSRCPPARADAPPPEENLPPAPFTLDERKEPHEPQKETPAP